MNLNKDLFNLVVVAAAVAAVTAAGTSYLVLRYAPLGMSTGPVSADQARVEQITRDYLTKNPGVLVEMAAIRRPGQRVPPAEIVPIVHRIRKHEYARPRA